MSQNNQRNLALDQAIKANAGTSYDEYGRLITDANKIVEAAEKFEAYLKENSND